VFKNNAGTLTNGLSDQLQMGIKGLRLNSIAQIQVYHTYTTFKKITVREALGWAYNINQLII
jgi:hypothetical protein